MERLPSVPPQATVLLVQDVAAFRDLETTFLRRHELRVIAEESGDAARRRARTDPPQIVMVDFADARASVALCGELKADPTLTRVPVVLVLPRTSRAAGQAAGADALIFKPVVQREFLDAVRRFVPLTERRARRTPINLRFTWRTEGGVVGHSFSRDLSPSGAFLESDRIPPLGCPLHLSFRLAAEEAEIACGAHVRNVPEVGQLGFGVEFAELREEDRVRLVRFVDGVLQRSLASRD
ncbi:MAG TPA: PilZ domain-containing protein [Candidatus Polarisedimenticolaceae bacterium]|nr:PilZ domain-containing protein [Candidatus Polarisedimenticolaceae bacterium]